MNCGPVLLSALTVFEYHVNLVFVLAAPLKAHSHHFGVGFLHLASWRSRPLGFLACGACEPAPQTSGVSKARRRRLQRRRAAEWRLATAVVGAQSPPPGLGCSSVDVLAGLERLGGHLGRAGAAVRTLRALLEGVPGPASSRGNSLVAAGPPRHLSD